MSAVGQAHAVGVEHRVGLFPSLIFLAIFLVGFVSLAPYPDLSSGAGRSLALDQLTALALATSALVCAARLKVLPLVLQPRGIILLLFAWLALTSIAAPEMMTAWRRLLVTFLLCLNASLLLTLPKSRENFVALLTIAAATVIAMCYFGVLVLPDRAIHQAWDAVEPQLAGDWRGVFEHKNVAAPAMVIVLFIALFIASASSRALGWLLAVLALIFLIQSNGKSALGLLPVALFLAWLIERAPYRGFFLLIGFILGINFSTVGSALSPAIFDFVDGLGIDATFTARSDVWKLALSGVAEHPWTGFGFQSFWQTDTLQESDAALETWAVTAAHAHNSYIDVMIDGGIPALGLTLIWLVFSPIRDLGLARRRGTDQAMTRLYTRIWVFSLILASLESMFFMTQGVMWFALLLAVSGIKLQARADLIAGSQS